MTNNEFVVAFLTIEQKLNKFKEMLISNSYSLSDFKGMPWINHSQRSVSSTFLDDKLFAKKTTIILSTQRSGSTYFCQLLKSKTKKGNPREHFNHSFRGDFGPINFNDVWYKGEMNNTVSHKLMGSDLPVISHLLNNKFPGKGLNQSLASFFGSFEDLTMYRVERKSLLDQLLSSLSAQQTGTYFGGGIGKELEFNVDDNILLRSWFALIWSDLYLDNLIGLLPNESVNSIIYEDDLVDGVSEKVQSFFALSGQQMGSNDSHQVLKPPRSNSQKEDFKLAVLNHMRKKYGEYITDYLLSYTGSH
ncbi:Stf0 family sulfotransferase [Shewanella metallivivens]|uniref:Stf0 family sulfotransferase n=1 Tax=Shewanella metallivivens TaxID=2872342 RepID=A0ABT5TL49_9GAMM|nr:Stf0 family sulfotransferase [Shewanella metallivivens]MDD8059330.1 Stf0 family sulfotransferase [Shewanella metallivivens]